MFPPRAAALLNLSPPPPSFPSFPSLPSPSPPSPSHQVCKLAAVHVAHQKPCFYFRCIKTSDDGAAKRRGDNGATLTLLRQWRRDNSTATTPRRQRRGDNGAATTVAGAATRQRDDRQRRWRGDNDAVTMARCDGAMTDSDNGTATTVRQQRRGDASAAKTAR
jgi:hypothetical protein